MSTEERFWKKVDVRGPDECWEWNAYRNPQGYGQFRVSGRSTLTHRVSWVLVIGPIPDGLCVLHSCDHPPCVNPAHLRTGTQAENMRDMKERERGGKVKGTTHPSAKLSEDDVLDIRARCGVGETRASVARLYGVSRPNVSQIVSRKIWAHI